MMRDMRACFAEYGADYTTTIQRFMQNEALYMRLLGKFFSNNEFRNLGEALKAGDIAGAFKSAHTLKGVTGNLGLTPLYEAICVIAEVLRSGDELVDASELYHVVEMEFKRAEEFWTTLKGLKPDS